MVEYEHTLDVKGLQCPLPILKAKKALAQLVSGEVLFVIATDPGSVRDFDAFSRQTGHAMLESYERDGSYHFLIKKS
ncbi:MAG TPA: SirA family protein [Gammaproteobacteria bacterium]|nr:SirA family protein [Gammaproteobacteria bacterium]